MNTNMTPLAKDKTGLKNNTVLDVGIDVGSTTTKIVVVDPARRSILFSLYRRHDARQLQSVCNALQQAAFRVEKDAPVRIAVCGSGGRQIAEHLNASYIQEVVANSLAIRMLYAKARTAIELGGQDAKMIFFSPDETSGQLQVSDMRMNGSCAGGTGAFLDEIATLLDIPVERYDDLARRGKSVYNISGRCGVYAKTDIQPLLNRGVSKEDIALSALHAIAKQTIGGLAQGLEICAPVVFEGGPMTFNSTLVKVFAQRLGLNKEDILRPEHPETFVALGTALSLENMFDDTLPTTLAAALALLEEFTNKQGQGIEETGRVFFELDREREEFNKRHGACAQKSIMEAKRLEKLRHAGPLRVYLGIDSGSTTTKFVFLDEDGTLIDSFYAPNTGDPLEVARHALIRRREFFRRQGIAIDVIAAGTTGYGEQLFSKAFCADFHCIETIAHTEAARSLVPDATFVLDIGGQDMKAITLADGVITDIIVNEACSSGCGSFLENFAASLQIPVNEIAKAAFRSTNPAILGSRCTVFMNSSIVNEQRRGKNPDDIMAGLCRSIIENVFTKVIRLSNLSALGDRVVVQGGTFQNDAVLRAFEQYIGKEVIRAPYPGLMGAIGVAMLTKAKVAEATGTTDVRARKALSSEGFASTFIGLDALDDFSSVREPNRPCPFCSNHCTRTIVRFSTGAIWVTGNRCERGEIVKDLRGDIMRTQEREPTSKTKEVFDLHKARTELVFKTYPYQPIAPENGILVGLPRVLEFWDNMPFWSTLFRSLGFQVKLSHMSTRKRYEENLSSVTSDTVCFPAKLVHGHVEDLVAQGVDRVFMPVVTTVVSENTQPTSQSMCAVLKGYPLVIRNSDDPSTRYNIAFDDPLFHWYSDIDRTRQLSQYFFETYGIKPHLTQAAILQGDAAMAAFHDELVALGTEVLEKVARRGSYAVVLASRPYQSDALVNHDLPGYFTRLGVDVLTADSLPGLADVDLSKSRLDIVNNYHARMLSSALLAARNPHLEYVQVVSFGCGHDAYLSDEIIRLMQETGKKTPLVLKLDESDIEGPLRIRVRSFIETVNMRRASEGERAIRALPDPYPVKYTKRDRREKVILVPNTSHAFCRLMTAAMIKQGIRAEPLDIGGKEAIRLGKQYVHNDICFPAQMTIGEALAALTSGEYDDKQVAIGTGKYIGDCRLTHYAALLRKALDEAGFSHVPIITNDDVDYHDLHEGFRFTTISVARIAIALPMIDALEELLRKIRPYEQVPGSADHAFETALDVLIDGLAKHGIKGAIRGFKQSIAIMNAVDYDRSTLRPRVLIVGEYLLNFHPGANHDVEGFLESNGMEVIEARMTDVIRKTYFYKDAQVKEFHVDLPGTQRRFLALANRVFEFGHDICDRIASAHPLYEPAMRMPDLVKASDPIIHHTFDAGEGVLIPGEILHHASRGCKAFVILQPFSCLPNHVCGRGITKRIKEIYPDVQVLPLDFDPDASFANIENRLQMLVMNAQASNAREIIYTSDVTPEPKIVKTSLSPAVSNAASIA